jgi:phosphoglycolate phosphatase-like HAD superfamily hydrolase
MSTQSDQSLREAPRRFDEPLDGTALPRWWVFDVDGCLVDSLIGTSLRPLARDLLEHLAAQGCETIWWSAGGQPHARARAERFGVDHLVTRFCEKDERDLDRRYATRHLGVDLEAAIFVDDRPEDMPVGAQVIAVAPYLVENPRDRGLAAASLRAGLTI